MTMADYTDRARGMLYGAALGDALGVPHEFRATARLAAYTGRLEVVPRRVTRWQGVQEGRVGQTSDDTAMTVALLGTLATHRGAYRRDAALETYITWVNSGTR